MISHDEKLSEKIKFSPETLTTSYLMNSFCWSHIYAGFEYNFRFYVSDENVSFYCVVFKIRAAVISPSSVFWTNGTSSD